MTGREGRLVMLVEGDTTVAVAAAALVVAGLLTKDVAEVSPTTVVAVAVAVVELARGNKFSTKLFIAMIEDAG